MPNVLQINITINQFLWLLREARHSAIPFQASPQTANAKNNKAYEGLDSSSINFMVCGSSIVLIWNLQFEIWNQFEMI